MGAGMQEYFAAAATMVTAPWLNVQGNAADGKFHWIVGDYRQQYSPLTLYAPTLDILYEPMIFARKREIAMGDALLEGNQRNLQGFNLQFRDNLDETFGELRVEALGARLRRAGYLDETGAMGNILPNENIAGSSQAGTFDKFLVGGNVELLPLNKNVLVGISYLTIFDDKSSALKRPNGEYMNRNDTLPQSTQIFAGRVGADLAELLEKPWLIANVVAEYATSNDNVYEAPEGEFIDKFLSGKALLATLNVGYKEGPIKAVLSGNFIANDSAWFNPLAQTPQFFARRILNSDKDNDLTKYGVYAPLYSTFDALYNFTPKHSPMAKNLSNAAMAQTSSYNIAPYVKSSWNAATLTRAELALLQELSDMNLQLALPNGLATANRTGATGTFTLGYGEYIEAKALFTSLNQSSAIASAKEAAYTEFGGGAKLDVFGLMGFDSPMEISGSYKNSKKEQEWEGLGITEFNSDFMNAGFYWRFFRRFGFSVGYQLINSSLNSEGAQIQAAQTAGLVAKIVPVVSSTQNQWMVGIDYTIAPHAWLSISYGVANVENTYNVESFFQRGSDGSVSVDADGRASIISGTNLPDYIANVKIEPLNELKHNFSRNVLEAAINVEF